MTTKLDGELRRELLIGRQPYTLTLSQKGFTLALKGRRKGLDIVWADLVSGDAALATALNASLKANIAPKQIAPAQQGQSKAGAADRPAIDTRRHAVGRKRRTAGARD